MQTTIINVTFHATSNVSIMDTIDRDTAPKKPAAKPREKTKVLRAKPMQGEVDWAELTQDTIKKFPKILAALAK